MMSTRRSPFLRTMAAVMLMVIWQEMFSFVSGLSVRCNTCDANLCPDVTSCEGGTVRDICGCCMVCARGFNDTCGGRFGMLGKCGPGLRCVVTVDSGHPVTGHEPGICKVDEQRTMSVNPCLSIVCDIQMTPDCPIDSIPVGGHPPPGECCPFQGPQCVCTKCQPIPACEGEAMAPVLIKNGTYKPGSCCSVYDCVPKPQSDVQSSPCTGSDCMTTEQINSTSSTSHPCFDCNSTLTSDSNQTTSTSDLVSEETNDTFVPASTADYNQITTMSNITHDYHHNTTTDEMLTFNHSRGGDIPYMEVVFPTEESIFNCSGLVCPSNNTEVITCPADSFQMSAKVTPDGCCYIAQGCECLPDDFCPSLECADGLFARVMLHATRKPGYCCDVMQCVNSTSCIVDGTEVKANESWLRGECETCQCLEGEQKCTSIHCDEHGDCTSLDPGHCCATCAGCLTDDGTRHSNDGQWTPDNCTVCECTQGQIYCKDTGCENEVTDLPLPAPSCLPLHGCDLNCVGGLARDENDCLVCQCDEGGCILDCPHGFILDNTGAALCVCASPMDSFKQDIVINNTPVPETDTVVTSDDKQEDTVKDAEMDFYEDYYYDFSRKKEEVVYPPEQETPDLRIQSTTTKPPGFTVNIIYNLYDVIPFSEDDPNEDSLSHASDGDHDFYENPPIIIDEHYTSTNPHYIDADILYGPDDIMGVPMGCPPLTGCNIRCAYGMKIRRPSGCPRCRCRKCPDLTRCGKVCKYGYVYNNKNCKLCKCKDAPNSVIDLSQHSYSGSYHPSRNTDSASSSQCMSLDGRVQQAGEFWHDGCRRCYCAEGREMCALITCPQPQCAYPVIRNGDCCPSCSGELLSITPGSTLCQTADGRQRVQGETWYLDACTQCICQAASILCEVEACPPLLCQRTIRHAMKCCRVCADGSEFLSNGQLPGQIGNVHSSEGCVTQSGTGLDHGTSWKVHACQSCTCTNGQIHCFHQACPTLTCNRTIMKKGHCCPQCSESEVSGRCLSSREVYHVGEQWMAAACTQCVCRQRGEIRCQQMRCPPLHGCAHVIDMPGVCCPICYNVTQSTLPILNNGATVRPVTHHFDGHDENSNNHSVIKVLVGIVSILILLVIILMLVICYLRRRNRKRKLASRIPVPSGNVRPKSTNLDFQGNPPPLNISNFSQWQRPPEKMDKEMYMKSNDFNPQNVPPHTGGNTIVAEEYNDLNKSDLKTDIYKISAHNESFVKSESPTCSIDSTKEQFSCCNSNSSINSIISDKKDTYINDDSASIQSSTSPWSTTEDDLSSLSNQLANEKLIVRLPEDIDEGEGNITPSYDTKDDGDSDCGLSHSDCYTRSISDCETADNWSNQIKEQQLLDKATCHSSDQECDGVVDSNECIA